MPLFRQLCDADGYTLSWYATAEARRSQMIAVTVRLQEHHRVLFGTTDSPFCTQCRTTWRVVENPCLIGAIGLHFSPALEHRLCSSDATASSHPQKELLQVKPRKEGFGFLCSPQSIGRRADAPLR